MLVLGAAVSSAILYLAIIAIWAVFLVPAWVRRPHTRSEDSAPEAEPPYAEDLAPDEPAGYPDGAASDADFAAEAASVQTEAYAEAGNEYYEIEYREEEYVAAGFSREYETHPQYGDQVESAVGPGEAGQPAAAVASPGEDYPGDGYPGEHSRPSQSRQQMLHARRRMLAILAGMTAVTMAFTALGLVSWWICIPPAGLLVLYVMLLREIAIADAELARKRSAWEHARAEAYERHLQAVAERESYEASLAQPQPEAEIIDISGRVADADQPYDQYADAAVRAVGD